MSNQKIPRSLTALVRQIENDLQGVRDDFLKQTAEHLVKISPVDTGAYVTSHSITTNSGSGRARTSRNKPGKQSIEGKHQEALGQLMGDIATLPPEADKVYINNRSPHNKFVEFGVTSGHTAWKRTGPFMVYNRTMQRAPEFLANAVNKVKGRSR